MNTLRCDAFWNDPSFWGYDARGFEWYYEEDKLQLAIMVLLIELRNNGPLYVDGTFDNFRQMQLLQYLANAPTTGSYNEHALAALTNSLLAETLDNSFDKDRLIDASQFKALADRQLALPAWRVEVARQLEVFGVADIVMGIALYGVVSSQQQPPAPLPQRAVSNTGSAGSKFEPPRVSTNSKGQLTNGTYTIDSTGMAKHTTGSTVSGKSQFLFNVDANRAVLDAAAYADKYGLWINNQAKIPITNGNVGVVGRTGELTNWIEVTKTNTGFVHGWPCKPG